MENFYFQRKKGWKKEKNSDIIGEKVIIGVIK